MKKDSIYRVKLSQNGKSVKLPKWVKFVELPKNPPEGFNVRIDSSDCDTNITVLAIQSQTIERLEDAPRHAYDSVSLKDILK